MIDAFVRNQPHYVRYAAAVLAAIPEDRRGTLYLDVSYNELAPYAPAEIRTERGRPPDGAAPVIVAGAPDLDAIGGRPAIYVEHGAGQSYIDLPDHPGYSGGLGRDNVVHYLVPNEWTAAKCRARQPHVPTSIIGDPTLDVDLRIRSAPRTDPPSVAVTFHWDGHAICPEAGTGWHAWAWPILDLRDTYRLIGHAHPRIAYQLLPWWAENGVEAVEDRDEVLARADVLIADNTSLIWEAARLDIPVVLLNNPGWRPNPGHGPPRFSRHAEVGPNVTDAAALPAAIERALAGRPADAAIRAMIAEKVYPYIGAESAARIREALA